MNTRTWSILLLAGLLALPLSADARRKKKRAEEVDYLELATILVRDGKYQRAAGVLAEVNTEDEKLDKKRFYLVKGLAELNLNLFSQAASDFTQSIQNGQEDPIVSVYLGQAHFYANQYDEALRAMAGPKARAKADTIPSTFALRAEALWKLERPEEAWDMLVRGERLHPDYVELLRRKVYFAVERGLYQTAAELGVDYLGRFQASASDYLALGSALYRSGSAKEALKFLELARLRYPDDTAVAVELARVYKDQSSFLTAAGILERIGLQNANDDLLLEAGELYKRAGQPHRVLALNGRIGDSQKRLRQRLSVLLELRQYELVATMARDLTRVGLLKDESIRYALAYAFFKAKNYGRAEKLLTGLKDPQIFHQATELRKAMVDCRRQAWRC